MSARKNIRALKPKAPFNARRDWHHESHGCQELLLRDGYHAAKCEGAAHTNPHIDNCMICLNHAWGWVAVKDGAS